MPLSLQLLIGGDASRYKNVSKDVNIYGMVFLNLKIQ